MDYRFGRGVCIGLIFAVLLPVTLAQCPSGFEQIYSGSSCYRLVANTLSWQNAASSCEFQYSGSHLVIVNDKQESEALWDYLHKNVANQVWTDGVQPNGVDPWVWSTTGEPIDFFAWLPGQPDNYGGNENCIDFWFNFVGASQTAYWNDDPCGSGNIYLCEIEV